MLGCAAVTSLSLLIAAFFHHRLFPVLGVNNADLEGSGLLTFTKVFAGVFFAVAIEGSRIVIVGTIVKAKVAGDEKQKEAMNKAQAAERRRMGKIV